MGLVRIYWQNTTSAVLVFHISSHFQQQKKGLHLDVLKADGVALMHCSAYIVTLSHTDRLNAISQLDKEYKSYAISKLNNEHLLLVKWHKASQKKLKNDECALSV